jgi:putative phosphoesterase
LILPSSALEIDLDKEILRVAVIADTHIPDRIMSVPKKLLEDLRSLKVAHILHAGDICVPGVLKELESIAPVSAVRGNRDFLFKNTLPLKRSLDIGGMRIALMHGSGTIWDYFKDKWAYVIQGYQLERYIQFTTREAEDARVIVFGHTHRPANVSRNGKLFFNPGSACFPPPEGGKPSYGLLKIYSNGDVTGEIVPLPG